MNPKARSRRELDRQPILQFFVANLFLSRSKGRTDDLARAIADSPVNVPGVFSVEHGRVGECG